ncbi:MAG TPA: bifunctional nuclease family protein [Gemmatimonadaceae bacterium]|jgi:bifunctional DNase/RNase|nr:bifunctional nuclease family protein [Gemmatimonadaceae bacterium]
MVEVHVIRLAIDGVSNAHVVILQEKGGDRLLPIWIGAAEADSILMEINNVKKERPLTHDLCKTLIAGLGGELRRVQITRVAKGTYYAELHIVRGGEVIQVDARPSDSIAIALRFPAPIFADESLLVAMGEEEPDEGEDVVPETPPAQSTDDMTVEQLQRYLSNLRPEDFGKFNL